VKGQSSLPAKVRLKEVSVHLDSYLDDGAGNFAIEAPGTKPVDRAGRERVGGNAREA